MQPRTGKRACLSEKVVLWKDGPGSTTVILGRGERLTLERSTHSSLYSITHNATVKNTALSITQDDDGLVYSVPLGFTENTLEQKQSDLAMLRINSHCTGVNHATKTKVKWWNHDNRILPTLACQRLRLHGMSNVHITKRFTLSASMWHSPYHPMYCNWIQSLQMLWAKQYGKNETFGKELSHEGCCREIQRAQKQLIHCFKTTVQICCFTPLISSRSNQQN